MGSRDGIVVQDSWKRRGKVIPAAERGRAESRWRARVWDPNRRRYLAAGYHPTMAAATKAAKAKQAELEIHRIDQELAPRLSIIGPAYVESLRHRIGKPAARRHIEQVEGIIERLIVAGADDMASPAFPGIVERFIGRLTNQSVWLDEDDRRPASESTKRKYLIVARALCTFARKRRLLVHNPLDVIKLPPKARQHRPVYPLADLRRLVCDDARWIDHGDRKRAHDALAIANGNQREAAARLGISPSTLHYRLSKPPQADPWWPYVCLMVYTGARATEVQNLEWQHWDRGRNRLTIPAEHPGNKTRRERRIPVQPELRAILWSLPVAGDFVIDEDLVRRTESERNGGFKAYCKRHGVQPVYWPVHALRRSTASLMTALGLSPHVVMDWAGHATSDVSRDYTAGHDEYRDEVASWPQPNLNTPDFYLRRPIPGAEAETDQARTAPA